jgi:hypothetical protein
MRCDVRMGWLGTEGLRALWIMASQTKKRASETDGWEKKLRGHGNCFRLAKGDGWIVVSFSHVSSPWPDQRKEMREYRSQAWKARLSQTMSKLYPVQLTKK